MTTYNKLLSNNKEVTIAEGQIYYAMEHLKFALRHAYARSQMTTAEYKDRMIDAAVAAEDIPRLVHRFVAIILYDVDNAATPKEL